MHLIIYTYLIYFLAIWAFCVKTRSRVIIFMHFFLLRLWNQRTLTFIIPLYGVHSACCVGCIFPCTVQHLMSKIMMRSEHLGYTLWYSLYLRPVHVAVRRNRCSPSISLSGEMKRKTRWSELVEFKWYGDFPADINDSGRSDISDTVLLNGSGGVITI